MPTIGVTADVDRYDEALTWFQKRTVMTAATARALDDKLKQEAFWVGGGLTIEQVQRVHNAISTAIEKGTPFEDFRKAMLANLSNPAHSETVFRNAVQRSYNAGRWAQMREPNTLKLRPWWLFDAVLDARTTVICSTYNGTLLPASDPWWLTRIPPIHHRCRSGIRNLRRAEAEKRGVTTNPPTTSPESGWGSAPGGPGWKPNPKDFDPSLNKAINAKATTGTRTRKPRTPKEHTAKHWEPTYRAKYGDAAPSLAHGRAALERGLDMTVEQARAQLKELNTPGATAMLDALQDADAALTIRSQAGELDPLRKAAAATAGHLQMIGTRTAVEHKQLARLKGGKDALDLLSKVTGKSVVTPGDDWTFTVIRSGISSANHVTKQVKYLASETGTLEHELAHTLEALNPKLLDRARAFLKSRAGNAKPKTYGTLRQPYTAWEDSFIEPYIGRRYLDASGVQFGTEITSMAMELFVANEAHWGQLTKLMQVDHEHFLFLLGQLAGP